MPTVEMCLAVQIVDMPKNHLIHAQLSAKNMASKSLPLFICFVKIYRFLPIRSQKILP